MSGRLGWALALCGAALAAPAHAQPSIWQEAARRELRPQAQAIATVDRLLAEHQYLMELPTSFRRALVLSRARRMLENIGAARSKDPAIRFRIGQVYYLSYNVDRDEPLLQQAAEHLAFVARSDAPASMRADALSDLAICYARLGRHREEVEAYTQALALEPHAEMRAILLANRAEGYMVQGNITNAVRGYRASLKETPSWRLPFASVTTLWGLAVALDRSGDLEGGLEQIRTARSADPADEYLQSSSWFFVPEYDEHWYQALGHWQSARSSDHPEAKLEAYREAIASWRVYLDKAPTSDHWLVLAGLRLRQCEKELDWAAKQPPAKPRAPDDEDAH